MGIYWDFFLQVFFFRERNLKKFLISGSQYFCSLPKWRRKDRYHWDDSATQSRLSKTRRYAILQYTYHFHILGVHTGCQTEKFMLVINFQMLKTRVLQIFRLLPVPIFWVHDESSSKFSKLSVIGVQALRFETPRDTPLSRDKIQCGCSTRLALRILNNFPTISTILNLSGQSIILI